MTFANHLAMLTEKLGRQPRILIVEDEALIALHMRISLNDTGLDDVLTVATSAAALAAFAEQQPDLVLMDVTLRGESDGVQTVQKMRESRTDFPVIYVTGQADDATQKRAEITRPTGYLIKPFATTQLCQVVYDALADGAADH